MHFSRRCSVLSLCGSRCGINVLCQQLEHKLVCFMRWPQDVWLWRLISSSLTAPVLILSPHTPLSTPPTPPSSLSPVSLPRRLTACSCGIRSFCSQVIVCVPHYVCVLPASHTEIMCISSYSQANPPPIIVNADSLDAGPYVSICSRCLLHYISLSFTLPLCQCMNMFVCLRVCVDEKASSWQQHAVCHVDRHPFSYWLCPFVGIVHSAVAHVFLQRLHFKKEMHLSFTALRNVWRFSYI